MLDSEILESTTFLIGTPPHIEYEEEEEYEENYNSYAIPFKLGGLEDEATLPRTNNQ